MIDRLVFLERKSGLSVNAFQRHWRDVHGPIAAEIPGLRSYIQCDLAPDLQATGNRLGSLTVDGIAFLSFDDLPAIKAAFTPAVIAALMDDEKAFVGGLDLLTTVPRRLLPEGNPGQHRLITLLQRREGVDAATFHDRWWMGGEDLAASAPRGTGWTRRLVIDHGLGPVPWGAPTVHGIEDFSCADPSNLEALRTGDFSQILAQSRAAVAEVVATWEVRAYRVV